MNRGVERFPLFDGLRAIAALSVLTYHAALFAGFSGPNRTVNQYTGRLDVGVTIFFLISAFLLYRPFVRARLRGDRAPAIVPYAWRRFLRIVPAYWVALTLVAVVMPLSYVFVVSKAPIYYGFAQIYFSGDAISGIGQAWTLCVEVTFYAFLPLWALGMRLATRGRDRRRILAVEFAGLAALFVFSTLYKVWALRHIAPTDLNSPLYLMPLPNFLDQFALGMGVAVLSVWYEGRALPASLALVRRTPLACWILALVAFWFASTQIGFNGTILQSYTRSMHLERHELYTVVALAMLLPAVFATPGKGIVAAVLGSRPLRYLGLVSYGIYLYQLAVVTKLQHWFRDSVQGGFTAHFSLYLVGGVLITTALASASYYLVERPALRLKRLVGPVRPLPFSEEIAEPAPATPPSLTPGA
jgi:peptidoglycan/LPS O-acetylase OafA/YrhL